MANTTVKRPRRRGTPTLQQRPSAPAADDVYKTFGDSVSVDEKLKILEDIGRPELIKVFQEYTPLQARRRRKGAPRDQRVSVTVTAEEKVRLDNELRSVRAAGEKVSASEFIRNRAVASVDINGWADIARKTLLELEDLAEASPSLKQRRRYLIASLEEIDDAEDQGLMELELADINRKLSKLTAKAEKRTNRLTGRMTMKEAEIIKWRAARLCLSSSDYLRMMLFSLEPNSSADAHLSLDAKRRFYVSVIDVANTGWGTPPNVYECNNCANYLEEIERLRERVRQLEYFS